jgi:opacity protein-like surface antigen
MDGQSRGKLRGAAAMLLALGMSVAPHAAAQPAGAGSPDVGKFYAFAGFAAFAPDSNDQFQGERGGAGLMVGGGFRFSSLLSFELGALGAGYRLDTPASVSAQLPATFKDASVRTHMSTGGLNLSVKFHFTQDRVDPYFGVGVGIYSTDFRTTSEASTCQRHCADTGPRVASNSADTGYHAVIGVDYHVTQKNVVGVEFRRLWLDANFGDIGLGKVKAGGSLLWLGYRRYF